MEHHGYELLATIDGTDTKFSCNLAHGLYSWMGAASEGGYLGSDFASFVSAVVSGAAGSYLVTLTEDAGIGTDLVIQPGQDVHISGDPNLAVAPSWGSGGFTVEEFGSLSVTNVQLDAIGAVVVVNGGSLSLANLALPAAAMYTALQGLSGIGSTLSFAEVTVPEQPDWSALTVMVTATRVEGVPVVEPPDVIPTRFVVISGPCTIAQSGRCVGRWPGGYLPNEDCEILVAGPGGALGPCPVFDTSGPDYLTLPDGTQHSNADGHYADCPAGAVLGWGQILTWHSDYRQQGYWDGGQPGPHAIGTGLPSSGTGPGGGWQICFA